MVPEICTVQQTEIFCHFGPFFTNLPHPSHPFAIVCETPLLFSVFFLCFSFIYYFHYLWHFCCLNYTSLLLYFNITHLVNTSYNNNVINIVLRNYIMICINITNFVLISYLKKCHSIIETQFILKMLFLSYNFKFYAIKKNNNIIISSFKCPHIL